MKENTFNDIPRYFNFFKKYLGNKIFIIFILVFISAIFESIGILMLLPLLEGLDTLNTVIEGQSSLKEKILFTISSFVKQMGFANPVVGILLIIIFVFIFKGIFFFLALAYNAILRARLLQKLKSKIYFSSYETTYEFISNENYGQYINLINEQASKAVAAFSSMVISGLSLVNSIVYVLVAMAISTLFGATTFVVGFFIYLIFKTLNNKVRRVSKSISEENGFLADLLITAYENFGYLVSTSKKEFIQQKITTSIYKIQKYQRSQGIFQAVTKSAQEPLAVSAMIGILIAQVIIFESSITPLLVSIALFYRGVNSLVMVQSSWQNCLDLIGGVEIIQESLEKIEFNTRINGKLSVEAFKNKIQFINVTYKVNDMVIIDKVNCEFNALKTYAIIGESGSGKSTLAHLALNLIKPSNGNISIDGQDLDSLKYQSYGKIVGYVPQDSTFINGSILENIFMQDTSKNIDIDFNFLDELIKNLNLAEVISIDKSNNKILEHKSINSLSGGQKQRLSILREIYARKNLLILDEPTSAQDLKNEKLIISTLENLKSTTTLIIITHKEPLLRMADSIYKMENGQLLKG